MHTKNNTAAQNWRLSKREQQVAKGLCAGLAPRQLATQLGVSYETVRKHRASLYRKLRVDCVIELMRILKPYQNAFFQPCGT
jgi:DNA-binding NarL/FixJ family response regulator